jgi:hypothetical protein
MAASASARLGRRRPSWRHQASTGSIDALTAIRRSSASMLLPEPNFRRKTTVMAAAHQHLGEGPLRSAG